MGAAKPKVKAEGGTENRIAKIVKRDGAIVPFDQGKITNAIFKAAESVGGTDRELAAQLSDKVIEEMNKKFHAKSIPAVEEIQDIVEKVLIESGHAKTAKAYILYRAKRAEIRKAAEKAAAEEDAEMTALWEMFTHKSKLASMIPFDVIDSYKDLLMHIKGSQRKGLLPVHEDYLGGNELAVSIYERKYYLKDLKNRRIEKRPEDVFARLASFMAAVEPKDKQTLLAEKYYNALYDGLFLPGGRVIAGAGDMYRLKTLANCFVTLIDDDNLESIYRAAYDCARTYSYGGGIGVDISSLRPRGSVLHNAADSSTGAVSFTELYSLTTGLIGQAGRRGALMITLDIKHPDSMDFIRVKKVPNWVTNQIVEQCRWSGTFSEEQLKEIERQARENTQVRFANISLKVSDEFMQAVKEQNDYGPKKILVYKKDRSVSGLGVQQGGEIHYSYGIPSKPIEKYELLRTFDTLEQLNKFLAKQETQAISEFRLNDINSRDMFGDIEISLKGSDHDLAVRMAGDFMTYFNSPPTGEIKKLVKAREIWDAFIQGNYATAEPGLIFWTTMTKYSPSNYVGRPVISTNPCVAADSLISTEKGLERIDSITAENIIVDTRLGGNGLMQFGTRLVKPLQNVTSGYKDCYLLETKSGYELTATPGHRIMTTKGWKDIKDITDEDYVYLQSGAGKFNNDSRLPFEVTNRIIGKRNRRIYNLNLPSEWSRELALLLGWLVGDGFIAKSGKIGLVFAKEDEEARRIIQPIFEKYCNREIKETKQPNGCVQIRSSSKFVLDFLEKLGVKISGQDREVPAALFTATQEAVIGFLEGLFSSDGTIALGSESRNYVRLNSSSLKLLKQVQLLLLNLGIKSTIYNRSTRFSVFRYTNKKGELIKYKTSGINYELNISKQNVARFIKIVDFLQARSKEKIYRLEKFEFYRETFVDRIKRKEFVGTREVWDITEPETSSFIANGIVVHNCGEVPLEDGGACNLGSLNLSRFVTGGYTGKAGIDWDKLSETTELLTRFLDSVVKWNESLNPLEKQRKAAAETRRLGLGVMGIADMLNQLGIAYDSKEGIDILEKIMKTVANVAYVTSAKLAAEKGPSPIFDYTSYSECPFFSETLEPETREMVRKNGLRNIAILSIAPTGTISNIALAYKLGNRNFIGVSSGIEPIFALYYSRRAEIFGNQIFRVFHSTVQAYLEEKGLIEKAQKSNDIDELRKVMPAHFFRTAHFIDPGKRVQIQGICQKYIDHSISSTVNLPEDIEPEVISNIYLEAWKNGLKGITIYRDASRYPILSVDSSEAQQANGFGKAKNEVYRIQLAEEPSKMLGGDVVSLDGRLTTVYHALQQGLLIQDEEGILRMPAREVKEAEIVLEQCPSCSSKTLKYENGCKTCINEECGYGACEV